MSDLRRAHEALTTAGLYLERAEKSVPHFSVEALGFLRCELGVCRRRLSNMRKVLGDIDHTPSTPDPLGPLSGGGASPGDPDSLPSGPDLFLGGNADGQPPS